MSTSTKAIIRICVQTVTVFEILTFQIFDLENKGEGHWEQHRSDNIRWGIPTSVKVIVGLFTLALPVSMIIRFEMYDLENLSQGHGVQLSQWSNSMPNINLYHIWAIYHRFPDIIISNVTLKKQVKVTMYNIRNGVIRWQIHDFLFDSSSNICSISKHLRDIRKNNDKTLTLKIKVKVNEEKKRDLSH